MSANDKRTFVLSLLLIAVSVAILNIAVLDVVLIIAGISVNHIMNIALFFLNVTVTFNALIMCNSTKLQS